MQIKCKNVNCFVSINQQEITLIALFYTNVSYFY